MTGLAVDVRRSICNSRLDDARRHSYNLTLDKVLATAAGQTAEAARLDELILAADDQVFALEAELRSLDAEYQRWLAAEAAKNQQAGIVIPGGAAAADEPEAQA